MNENMHQDILNRLLQGASLRRDSQLAELLEVSPQAVSQARRKGRVPEAWVLKVAQLFDLSTDWLFFGIGEAKRNAMPEPAQLQKYGKVRTPQDDDLEIALIPRVSARLAAGTGSLDTGADVVGYFAFQQDWLCRKGNPDSMVLMEVTGDSMEPSIQHGDLVLVDQSKKQIYGHAIYAVGVNEEIYVKQIVTLPGSRLVLRSLNPDYEPIEINLGGDLADSVRIIGRVLWWCREA